VEMGVFTGQARIWGTSNPRYWANLDPERPKKKVGLILDLGRHVKPYITPDDADAVLAIIRRRSNLAPGEAHGESERGPFV